MGKELKNLKNNVGLLSLTWFNVVVYFLLGALVFKTHDTFP